MSHARLAVSTLFFVNGAVLASWLPHIPAVKARLTSGDGQLGLVLLAMAGGAAVALPAAGWLIGRLGSRVLSSVAVVALCVAMPLPVFSPTLPALVVALAALGACRSARRLDERAGRCRRAARRAPIMSFFHALFSLGGVAGAFLATGAMSLGLGDRTHVGAAAVVAPVAVALALPGLVSTKPEPDAAAWRVARPSRALLALGVLALLGLLAEGAMADWSAVYLHDTLGASPAFAAVGFAAFSLAMAAGRMGGDGLMGRLGPRRVLRLSAGVAAVGLAGALLLGQPATGVAGCALVGLSIANIIPVLFSAAARVRGLQPGRGLAAVATTGYLGFLAGPPLIGAVAEAWRSGWAW